MTKHDDSAPQHWQSVYESRAPDDVSWYRPHLEISLDFIRRANLDSTARIVDFGGGASTFVDDLLDAGFRNLAVVDLAASALNVAKERLGSRAKDVDWIVGDVTAPLLPDASIDFWHDRAVFHFLTTPAQQAAYLAQVHRSTTPNAHVMVATFGPDGPLTCSGLPVARYRSEDIHSTFGDAFEKIGDAVEEHTTPWGAAQSFSYCFCRRSTT